MTATPATNTSMPTWRITICCDCHKECSPQDYDDDQCSLCGGSSAGHFVFGPEDVPGGEA